ncbi:hypothetical protein [Tropicimonas sediminicola]|uniref:Glycosyl transferase family 2 n=1 Tax=Tropicimonas sediminicola TaxID=1031541 RepID=A0A239CRR2_9RHOB|nr:hypothetical protein [Tropicimonas sediminicola]SNS22562.1 hypothetical protein SAMN05421757_101428 [Tropicimonas sediminicola]
MVHPDLDSLLAGDSDALSRGPVAVILAEDAVELDSTIEHHLGAGFRSLVVLTGEGVTLPADLPDSVRAARFDPHAEDALTANMNRLIAAAPPGTWMYYCYNGEYLFFPFCEHRTVGEMLSFHAEERRDAMLTFVVDLYADDLGAHPNAVSRARAHIDRTGYFALAREGAKERQLDFYGGLRWRFEEHVPKARRRIDRISLFRTRRGLHLRPDHTFDDEEYNTYACPWHHNLTAAVCSFRAAKALKLNPGSTFDIPSFWWTNSVRFDWSSRQLMDLGLMEPGQWF